MNSLEKKEVQEIQPDDPVEIIPYDLLEIARIISGGGFGSLIGCIYKPSNEGRILHLLSSKPEEWFTNELACAFRLKHENIIKTYGRTCMGGIHGVLTEWVKGPSLKQVIYDESISYTFADIFLWNAQSFSALEYVIESFPGKKNEHFRRYFNRIVCPENMILNHKRDVLKICSLGLFKDIPDPQDESDINYSNYSDYLAPEVRKDEYKYEKSDVYPFGVVLKECITRRKPQDWPQSTAIYPYLIFEDDLEHIKTSSMFEQFINLCTDDEPEDRLSVSMIKSILENMVLAEKGQKWDIFKNNVISIWNDEELYYCKKLIFVDDLTSDYADENPYFKAKQLENFFNYRLLKENLKELGRGSFGKVFLAEYGGNQIAVKFLSAMKMYPFLQEYSVLSQLKHENIVKVIGRTEEAGVYGIVMEYIHGTSLDKIIHGVTKEYSLGDVLKWSYQMASALEYMHSLRYLHRDVKPDNMLIEHSEKRTLKIVDLGGSKKVENSLNFTGMGTELYIAPEIDNRGRYNEKCDVYSWTISFWECCTAEKPQRLSDYRSKVGQICSAKFVEVVEKCSSKDPSDRKPMFIIRKWLGDMVNNRKAFTETDSTFRENCICVWNEPTNELYYFAKARSGERFQDDLTEAKAFFVNLPTTSLKVTQKSLRLIQDLSKTQLESPDKRENVKLIEVADTRHRRNFEKKKILKFSKDVDEKHLENEFVILSKLKHENIVKLFGYTHDKKLNFFGIITEYLPYSEILETVISRRSYITKCILLWSLQTARGLEYMHSQNILHCDFKPANIIVTDKQCQICDFKFSRDLQYSHPKEAVGTGIYMAPEVRRDGLLTTKSDVYSWTVTFMELCICEDVNPSLANTEDMHMVIEDLNRMKSIVLCNAGESYTDENLLDKFNAFIKACANPDPDIRWSMTDIVSLLDDMSKNHFNSSYPSDFHKIQMNTNLQIDIYLHSEDFRRARDEKHFSLASVDNLLTS